MMKQVTAEPEARLSKRALTYRQIFTLTLLFAGYASYYFCRADLSVSMPMLIEDLHARGISVNDATVHLGTLVSFGVVAYAAGKFILSGWADLWGGRHSFVAGLAGAILFTLLFAGSSALPILTLAWIGNRLIQSLGWAGLVKITSKWFSYKSYGMVAGFLSLSYLVGDALARMWMGTLIQAGFGWRSLFVFAAVVAGVVLLANLLFLRESRTELGFPAPEVNPSNAYATGSGEQPHGLREFLRPLLRNPGFWIVCFLSFGTTIIRETFNTWTPTYLHVLFGLTNADAAGWSAIFPGLGALSVLVSGWAGDRLGANGRAVVFFSGMLITAFGLVALTMAPTAHTGSAPVLITGLTAFGLLGPYSYLAGAMALDFGGSRGAATSSGFIDGLGYVGGILAGDAVASVATSFGWRTVFILLAVIALFCACACAGLIAWQRRYRMS